MIRTLFFVACLVALAFGQRDPVDQAEWFSQNGRLATGPFCDSNCIPGGDWVFRRDWVDLESEYEDIFMWQADSTAENWWGSGNTCGDDVNNMMYNIVDATRSRQSYKDCRPEIIYMIKFTLDYNHGAGYLLEVMRIDGSYSPTTRAWDNFVDDFFDMSALERVTRPWNLLRLIPSVADEPVIDDYDFDFALTQRYIANYERNFCSFQTSILPVQSQLRCRFNFDDDDTENGFAGLVTTGFCDYITETYEYDFRPGVCGDLGNDSCDVMEVDVVSVAKRMPASRIKALAASVRSNSEVNIEPVVNHKEMAEYRAKRDQYGDGHYDSQPIPDYGSCLGLGCLNWYENIWNQIGTLYKYTYVPYSSSITAPYCAYRD